MKNNSIYDENAKQWFLRQYLCFSIWLSFSAFLFTEVFIKTSLTYSTNIIFTSSLVVLVSFLLCSYCKVKHAVYFNLKMLKMVPSIDLEHCMSNIKSIAAIEEMLKANFINIMLMVVMVVSHTLIYQNVYANSLPLLLAVLLQFCCYGRLIHLKIKQATLYFPEVHKAHQVAINERMKLLDAEKHLPWIKRTF